MNDVMKLFFSLSVSGTIIALILFAIKPFCKNKISKAWQYYVWLVVIFRLLLPFSMETNIVGTLFSQAGSAVKAVNNNAEQAAFGQADDFFTSEENILQQPRTVDNAEVSQQYRLNYWNEIKSNIWLLWLGVATMLFVRKVTGYRSFLRYIKAGMSEVTDGRVTEIYTAARITAKSKKILKIYSNKLAVSPMLVGVFRPFIVLPDVNISETEMRNIFVHELTHYKRLDIFYKWLAQAAVCIHWYNPLVYFISREINKNCELSCDEAIIKSFDNKEKRSYGDTLLASLKLNGSYGDTIVSVTLNEDAKLLKERLGAIMKYKRKSKLISVLTAALTFAILSGAAITGAYAAENESKDNKASGTESLTDYPEITASYEISNTNVFDELAEKMYKADKLSNFGAVIPRLSEAKKIEYLNRAYNDDLIAYFSVVLQHCAVDNKEIDELAEKIYNDKKLSYLSVISPKISDKKILELAYKSYENNELSYYFILLREPESKSTEKKINSNITYTIDSNNPIVFEYDSSIGYNYKSGMFAATKGDTLTITVDSVKNSGTIELVLISPSGGKHMIELNNSTTFYINEESFWHYQCSGTGNSKGIKITGTITRGVGSNTGGVGSTTGDFVEDMIDTINYNLKNIYKSSYKIDENKINKADKAGILLLWYSGSWETTELLIPNMTEHGIDILAEIHNQKNRSAGKSTKKAADYYNLTGASADARALTMTKVNGTWLYIEPFFPYMSNKGIDEVIALYNQKHQHDEPKTPSDYYNFAPKTSK